MFPTEDSIWNCISLLPTEDYCSCSIGATFRRLRYQQKGANSAHKTYACVGSFASAPIYFGCLLVPSSAISNRRKGCKYHLRLTRRVAAAACVRKPRLMQCCGVSFCDIPVLACIKATSMMPCTNGETTNTFSEEWVLHEESAIGGQKWRYKRSQTRNALLLMPTFVSYIQSCVPTTCCVLLISCK